MIKKYVFVILFCIIMLLVIFQLDAEQNRSIADLPKKRISTRSTPPATISPTIKPQEITSPVPLDPIAPSPKASEKDSKAALLEKLYYNTLAVNELDFYTLVNTATTMTHEGDHSNTPIPYLETHYTYQGQLLRFPTHANYKVSIRTKQFSLEDRKIISDYTNEANYAISDSNVYFTTNGGELNYYPFTKEEGLLETVGQLEALAKLFITHESQLTTLTSRGKHYIMLNLTEEQFITYLPLLSETVFNGYFNTYSKTELEQQNKERELLNWPKEIRKQRLAFVLSEDLALESYYIYYESDAYGFNEHFNYIFSLVTSFFNIDELEDSAVKP